MFIPRKLFVILNTWLVLSLDFPDFGGFFFNFFLNLLQNSAMWFAVLPVHVRAKMISALQHMADIKVVCSLSCFVYYNIDLLGLCLLVLC